MPQQIAFHDLRNPGRRADVLKKNRELARSGSPRSRLESRHTPRNEATRVDELNRLAIANPDQ